MESTTRVWDKITTKLPDDVLTLMADEIWRRTRAPRFASERAQAELAVLNAETTEARQDALSRLHAVHDEELRACLHQAAGIGYALIETASDGYEAWCSLAMTWLKLPTIDHIEATSCWDQAHRVADALRATHAVSIGSERAA